MDNNKIKVSLPGAGETEPTINETRNLARKRLQKQPQHRNQTPICGDSGDSSKANVDFKKVNLKSVHEQFIEYENKSGRSEGVELQGQAVGYEVTSETQRKVCDTENNLEELNFEPQVCDDDTDNVGQSISCDFEKSNISDHKCSDEILNLDDIQLKDIKESLTNYVKIPPNDKNEHAALTSSSDNKENVPSRSSYEREISPPPVPLLTYRWEDVKRSKEKVRNDKGGYPWTYIDPPEPRNINIRPKDFTPPSKEIQTTATDALKDISIEEKEATNNTTDSSRQLPSVTSEENVENISLSKSLKEDIATCKEEPHILSCKTQESHTDHQKPHSQSKKAQLKSILKRTLNKKIEIAKSETSQTKAVSSKKYKFCHPLVTKLKTMADKQLSKVPYKRYIKRFPLRDDNKIVLQEEQQILKLKESPKAERKEFASYIVKQDSDEMIDIVSLDESPSEIRKRRDDSQVDDEIKNTNIVIPDEIIDLPVCHDGHDVVDQAETISEIVKADVKSRMQAPPPKTPRKKKEHVYEDIDDEDMLEAIEREIQKDALNDPVITDFMGQFLSKKEGEGGSKILVRQDPIENDIIQANISIQPVPSSDSIFSEKFNKPTSLLAPISSIDSTSSDEERLPHLASVAEESDQSSSNVIAAKIETHNETNEIASKSILVAEPSPGSDKKVTFSPLTDDVPTKEDVELPLHLIDNRWSKMSDHEYEPISEINYENQKPLAPPTVLITEPNKDSRKEDQFGDAECDSNTKSDTSLSTTQHPTMIRTLDDVATTSVPSVNPNQNPLAPNREDSVSFEELPLTQKERMKGFVKRANKRTKNMQHKLNEHAGKFKNKLSGLKKPKSESPQAKERKKFRTPEFSKLKNIHMPKINKPDLKFKTPEIVAAFKKPDFKITLPQRPTFSKPDMSKFKLPDRFSSLRSQKNKPIPTDATSNENPVTEENVVVEPEKTSMFKKPDFKITLPQRPSFAKPDMSKFKIPDRFSSLRLQRRKTISTDATPSESVVTEEDVIVAPKKRFSFGTYPRIFDRKKKQKEESSVSVEDGKNKEEDKTPAPLQFTPQPLILAETKPDSSKWDSKLSYIDSESGQFEHYDSEVGFDRESSLERRMRLDNTGSFDSEAFKTIQTEEQKQLADYDEENRVIHEISKSRENEFRQRKPKQRTEEDSDIISERSSNKEFGWVVNDHLNRRLNVHGSDNTSEREEYEKDRSLDRYNISTQETQSSGSPSNQRQKGVIEEIDDDEFFLRKKGISQDNIQIGRYISSAIRKGLDTPVNALAQLGQYDSYYDEDYDMSNERVNYEYDIPPSKPNRFKDYDNSLESVDSNQDDFGIPYDDDLPLQSENGYYRTFPPNRPLRKPRKLYSELDQEEDIDVPVAAEYYARPNENNRPFYEKNNIESFEKPHPTDIVNANDTKYFDTHLANLEAPPTAPKRRKKLRDSVDKDKKKSIPNSFPPDTDVDDIVVYRTEHEYIIPLAQPEAFTPPMPTPLPRSRSQSSRIADDDKISLATDSQNFNNNKFTVEIEETNGYAVVKKDPPPRPPAPIRRKRSTRSLGDRQFFTMPHQRKEWNVPVSDYTINTLKTKSPPRPPRGVSTSSLRECGKQLSTSTSDVTQYEEIDDFDRSSALKQLNSGPVFNKMKYRPLPPPPRPPREKKPPKLSDTDNNIDKKGIGNEKKTPLKDMSRISSEDMEEIEEVEVSTQTDPLPDDFCCEEFDINDNLKIIEPSFTRPTRTLEDILKENYKADIEKEKEITDETNLAIGIQKFREANQRSFSERSRGSMDRPKTPVSRPITPSTMVIEKKIVIPTVETDAVLIMQPVEDSSNLQTKNQEEDYLRFTEDNVDTEDERIVNEALKRYKLLDKEYRSVSPLTSTFVDESIEEEPSHLPVISTIVDELIEERPPNPPPRRKSSTTEVMSATIPVSVTDITPVQEQIADPPLELLHNNRVYFRDLEVESLNVTSLNAARVLVSDLQAISLNSQDLECKSANLVVKDIQLPPGFIKDIVEQVKLSENEYLQSQTPPIPMNNNIIGSDPENNSTIDPPARPPPPVSLYPSDYAPYSIPPPAFYQLRDYSDDPEQHYLPSPHRRRRHHRRRDDSTSPEDVPNEQRRPRHSTRSPDPSISELSGQIIQACGSSLSRQSTSLLNMLRSKNKEENRRDINLGLMILIVIVALLMMLGMSAEPTTVHHHHWDYFNPPDNTGRK